MKKILSSIIAVCMAFGSLGVTSYAADEAILPDGFNEWEEGMTVTDGTNQYKTLQDAVNGIHNSDEDDVLYCKPGADLGTMTHGHVCGNLTVYGNNAYISGGECDFEVDTYQYNSHKSNEPCTVNDADIRLIIHNLDNAAVWGQRNSEAVLNVELNDCDSINRIYISGEDGINNIKIDGCTFDSTGYSCTIYSNAQGSISVTDSTFTDVSEPINLNNKSDDTQTIKVYNVNFTDCGLGTSDDELYAAPIRVLSSNGGVSKVTVDTCSFTYAEGNVSCNGDILLGDGREGKTSYPVDASIINTNAEVQIQQPGDRTATENNAKVVEVEESAAAVALTNAVAETGGGRNIAHSKLLWKMRTTQLYF